MYRRKGGGGGLECGISRRERRKCGKSNVSLAQRCARANETLKNTIRFIMKLLQIENRSSVLSSGKTEPR